MNTDNINLVIASIRGEIEATKTAGFNMNHFVADTSHDVEDMTGRDCGTIACIAGHAYLLDKQASPNAEAHAYRATTSYLDVGAEFLGITDSDDAERLFYGSNYDRLEDITPEQAITVLEHLRDTGNVNWGIAIPELDY